MPPCTRLHNEKLESHWPDFQVTAHWLANWLANTSLNTSRLTRKNQEERGNDFMFLLTIIPLQFLQRSETQTSMNIADLSKGFCHLILKRNSYTWNSPLKSWQPAKMSPFHLTSIAHNNRRQVAFGHSAFPLNSLLFRGNYTLYFPHRPEPIFSLSMRTL